MIINWLEILLSYSFSIHHRPGILNILPDTLSRLFPARKDYITNNVPTNHSSAISHHPVPTDFAEPPSDVVPESERQREIELSHLKGHFGVKATLLDLIKQGKFWPSMRTDIESQLKSCPACHRWTITKVGYHPLTPITSEHPMDVIAMDTAKSFPTSPRGNNVSTRYNGTEFVNAIVHHLTTSFHIDHRLSTPYHPRANGLAERSVQTSCHAISIGNLSKRSVNKAQLAFIKKFGKQISKDPFPVNSSVMIVDPVRSSKNEPYYLGPFKRNAIDDQDTYVVDKILKHKGPATKRSYFVKWKHYDSSYNSWVKASDFIDLSVINSYWSSISPSNLGGDNDVFTLNVQGQLVRSQRWFWSRRTKQLYRNRYWLAPQVRPKTVKQQHSFALMETLQTCGDSASLQKYVTRQLLDTSGFFKDPSFDQLRAHGTRYLMLARMDALWTARKAIQIGILVDTHPFSVDHCILCDQQLLSTSIAHLVVECEQVTGHRIQSGLVPAIQKSRLRLLGRALDPGVENVYTWLRGGVLNGEVDLDQRWLDGTVEHESMGARHDNRALAARVN
ncbi:hypothetical protein BASA60_009755 [Batrachochytrium salamandrivorans]|nr:hypothetical protein BASA60_009755 [Batrachochytrium salamandrivorans]